MNDREWHYVQEVAGKLGGGTPLPEELKDKDFEQVIESMTNGFIETTKTVAEARRRELPFWRRNSVVRQFIDQAVEKACAARAEAEGWHRSQEGGPIADHIIGEISQTAQACHEAVAKSGILEAKDPSLLMLEWVVYVLTRVDVSMVRTHFPDRLRRAVIDRYSDVLDQMFGDLAKKCTVAEAVDHRMEQYGEIYRTKSGSEAFKALNGLLSQRLRQACDQHSLFVTAPLALDIIKWMVPLSRVLVDLEAHKIIPMEARLTRLFMARTS